MLDNAPVLQVGPAAVDAPPALVGKVQNFLADAGIGAGGGDATRRHFDYEPMLAFAMEEGLVHETADEIYRLWVERKMEGAIDSYDVVQSHLRDVPLKVRVHIISDFRLRKCSPSALHSLARVRRSSFAFAPTAWSFFVGYRRTVVWCRKSLTMQ